MNGIGGWFRRLGAAISAGFRHFMQGRYGGDKLNIALIWISFGAFIVSLFFSQIPVVNLILLLIYYGLLGWAIFRMLSRNTYKRYQENRKYLQFMERIKDRDHKYFDCPRCKQPVRVPRGKGKIAITCPKCKEKFIRKS
jgi:hypothetical protein